LACNSWIQQRRLAALKLSTPPSWEHTRVADPLPMVPDSRRRLRTPTSNTAAHPLYAVGPGCLFVAAACDGVTFLNIAHPPVDLLLTLLYRILFNEPRFSLYCCRLFACLLSAACRG